MKNIMLSFLYFLNRIAFKRVSPLSYQLLYSLFNYLAQLGKLCINHINMQKMIIYNRFVLYYDNFS